MQGAGRRQLGVLQFLGLGDVEGGEGGLGRLDHDEGFFGEVGRLEGVLNPLKVCG